MPAPTILHVEGLQAPGLLDKGFLQPPAALSLLLQKPKSRGPQTKFPVVPAQCKQSFPQLLASNITTRRTAYVEDMPRLVRRRPLSERIKTALNPWDFFLWLSEEIETRDIGSKSLGTQLGLGLNFVFLVARANGAYTTGSSYDDVFSDFEGSGWLGYIVSVATSSNSHFLMRWVMRTSVLTFFVLPGLVRRLDAGRLLGVERYLYILAISRIPIFRSRCRKASWHPERKTSTCPVVAKLIVTFETPQRRAGRECRITRASRSDTGCLGTSPLGPIARFSTAPLPLQPSTCAYIHACPPVSPTRSTP